MNMEKIGTYRWTICALLFFATTINYLDRQVLSLLAPDLSKEFGWSNTDYANITSVFQFAYAISMLFAGRFIDKLGTRKGFTWAIIIWSLAAIGMLQEIKPRSEARVMSLVIYAVMGWIVLVAIQPLLENLGTAGFVWLAAGGVFYTVGIIFFAFDERYRHWHGIWHLFVIAGSLMHYIAILFYVI